MAEIQWIKIKTNMFDDEKIKLIEKLPEGDTMLVIWLKLLCLAGKKNEGGLIYITRDIPYTPETMADIMNRDSRIISLALNTFKSFDMIEISDNYIQISNWEKHQNIAGMDKIREQNKERQRTYRQKQLESNVTVTLRNATDKSRIDKKRTEDIYNAYPSYCPNREKKTNKSRGSNMKKIESLIMSGVDYDSLLRVINLYVADCKKTKAYMMNFSTFLNNLPDEEELKKPVDEYSKRKKWICHNCGEEKTSGTCDACKKYSEDDR